MVESPRQDNQVFRTLSAFTKTYTSFTSTTVHLDQIIQRLFDVRFDLAGNQDEVLHQLVLVVQARFEFEILEI